MAIFFTTLFSQMHEGCCCQFFLHASSPRLLFVLSAWVSGQEPLLEPAQAEGVFQQQDAPEGGCRHQQRVNAVQDAAMARQHGT